LQADERNLAAELAAEKARKNAKDVWLHEAAHVLGDAVDLLESGARFAARATPGFPLLANPEPAESARGSAR
jgi:carboxyl-terminal processing protease